MNSIHTKYDKNTGIILGWFSVSNTVLAKHVNDLPIGQNYIETSEIIDPLLKYVDLNTLNILDRIVNPASINKTECLADALDSITISNLPIPCTVSIAKEIFEVLDGILEFTLDIPGIYSINIVSFPYQDMSFEVIAT